MRRRQRWRTVIAGIGLLSTMALPGCASQRPEYVAEIDAWHEGRESRLRSDTGWLTLVGLHPLREGRQTLGSSPRSDIVLSASAPSRVGTITLTFGRTTFAADSGADVELYDSDPPVSVRTIELGTDISDEPTVLSSGSLVMQVIDRSGDLFLRVKDRDHPAPREFAGIERYPVRESWRVQARLVPEGDGQYEFENVLGQRFMADSPGRLHFEIDGADYSLRPIDNGDGTYFILFGDTTNGSETYGAGRYVYSGEFDENGDAIIDFNKSYNPPCAFNDYSTCSLPPAGNMLPIAIRAGEKNFGGKDH